PPEAPLPGARLVLEPSRVKPAGAVLFGEIKVDRHRLPEDDAVIIDDRNMAVRVECEVRGRPRLAGSKIDLDMFVVETKLLGQPQGAEGTRPCNTIDLHRHARSPLSEVAAGRVAGEELVRP